MESKNNQQNQSRINLNMADILGLDYIAYYVDDVIDEEIALYLIDLAESYNFTPTQTSKYDENWEDSALRTNHCTSTKSDELTLWLQTRIKKHLPENNDNLHNLIRFNRFTNGQMVQPHVDGRVWFKDCESNFTIVIYLSNVQSGGETRFLNAFNMTHLDVKPKLGRMLVFDQRLCHAALPVSGDSIKYTLRTDAGSRTFRPQREILNYFD